MLIKAGIQLFQSSGTVDKVNATIASLKAYDTDGNLELDDSEIKNAIGLLTNAMQTNRDVKVAAQLAELRCMLIFIGSSQKMWARDPRRYNDKFSQSIPKLFGLVPLASWDSNPKIAKLEKIVCTFYKAGGVEKLRHKIQEAVKEETNAAIQEELFGTTFEEITEEILSEAFGDAAGELLMAFL